MTLFQMISIVLTIILGVIVFFTFKKEKNLSLFLKISVGIIFVSVCMRLFAASGDGTQTEDALYLTESILSGRFSGIFGRTESVLMLLLKWGTSISFATMFISAFHRGKAIRVFNLFYVPLILILNIAFFNQNVYSICGESTSLLLYYRIQQAFELSATAFFFFLNLKYEMSFEEDKIKKNYFLRALGLLPVLMLFFMPPTFLFNLFGRYGEDAEDFTKSHLIFLGLIFGIYFVSLAVLRNKNNQEKRVFLMLIALAAFYEYFTVWWYVGISLASYPFHICNTAVIFMLISICFNTKGLFYFTYFVNVLGTLFAMFIASGGDAFAGMEYWYNHGIDFTFPLLAVSLGIFERPKGKDMLKAMGVFTVYMVFVQIIGAINNVNIEPNTGVFTSDYFFLYGNKLTDFDLITKLATKLKVTYVYSVTINGNTYFMYWAYFIGIYITFIICSFIMWYLYDSIYRASDDFRLIRYKTRLKKERLGKTNKKAIDAIIKATGGKTMIKISHFSKKYGSSKNYAVKDFNLNIEDGDVFGFIGHNGAGKSTVIKSLVGIQSITEGSIEVCGFDIEKYPLQAKLNIGYVSDNHAVYEKLTGREYINYVADLYQVSKEVREERINYYAGMFGLTDALDRESKSYSHGMKQKLVVIASLIHDPKVWVLDEPLTGLDPTSSYQIKECMKEHAAKGNIVFFSTHVIEVIEKLCTKIAIISHGEMKGVYKIDDLKKQGISLEALYLKYVVSDANRGDFKEEDIATTDAGLIIEKQKEKTKKNKEKA